MGRRGSEGALHTLRIRGVHSQALSTERGCSYIRVMMKSLPSVMVCGLMNAHARRTWFMVVLALAPCSSTRGQSDPQVIIDSLETVFGTAQHDTTRASLLLRIAQQHIPLGRFDEVVIGTDSGLVFARKAGAKRLEADLLRVKGISYFYRGRYDEAEKEWVAGKAIAQQLKEKDLVNNFRGLDANLHMMRGDHARALELYLELLKVVEEQKNAKSIQVYCSNIGGIHIQQNEPAKAIPFLERALAICRSMNDPLATAKTSITLAAAYNSLRDFVKAEEHLQEAVQVAEGIGSTGLLTPALHGMVDVHRQRGQLDLALEKIARVEQLYAQLGDRCQLGMAHAQHAELLVSLRLDTNRVLLDRLYGGG